MKNDKDLVPDIFDAAVTAVAGDAGLISVGLRRALPAVLTEWERNASRCLKAAERASGMSRWDLDEVIANDPSLVSLTVRALHYAGMNGADEALLTMGAVLGASSSPDKDTSADEAALVIEAARNLTPLHLRLLRVLSQPRVDPDSTGAVGWKREDIAGPLVTSELTALMLLDSCVAAGTVTTANTYGGRDYTTSELGTEIIKVLDLVGDLPS